jgi:hypothetical protein
LVAMETIAEEVVRNSTIDLRVAGVLQELV